MDSLTKKKLTNEEITRLVKEAFGAECRLHSCQELEDGWFNTIYAINLKDEREVILKLAPPPEVKVLTYEKDIMRAEVEVMRLLKAAGNLPVPEVYFYDSSRTLTPCEYFFMEKVNGQPYNKIKQVLTKAERQAIELELGMYNKKINDIKGKSFGLYSQAEMFSNKWSEAFYFMVKAILQDGIEANVSLPREYKELDKIILKGLNSLDVVTEPRLVHWDLHDGNIFIDEEGKITGLIDFERSLWGDPLIEVYFGDFFEKTFFCQGYGIPLLNSEGASYRRVLYNVYLYLIMVIECKYRNFTNPDHIKWTYGMLEKEIDRLLAF